jgi:hypothetical protein
MRIPNLRDLQPYKGNQNLNRSDYFLLYGAQASGVLAGALQLEPGVGYVEALSCAMLGAGMGAAMILALLILIGQPPKIYTDLMK